MKKSSYFDMDGTLWDSVDEIVESWNKISVRKCTHPQRTADRPYGKNHGLFLQGNFSRNMRWIRRWRSFMPVSRDENEYPESCWFNVVRRCRKVFERLRGMGYEIGIVSNCQAGYIEVFLGITTWVIWWQISSVMATRSRRM